MLATARRLFGEQGYFSTGTNEIVEAAGVGTRGALYHHFAHKEALFRAVFEDVETDLGAKAGVAVTGETSFERLGQALHAFLDASLDPEVRRIILIDGTELARLMIAHGVGVTPVAVYELKRVDSDFFAEE